MKSCDIICTYHYLDICQFFAKCLQIISHISVRGAAIFPCQAPEVSPGQLAFRIGEDGPQPLWMLKEPCIVSPKSYSEPKKLERYRQVKYITILQGFLLF